MISPVKKSCDVKSFDILFKLYMVPISIHIISGITKNLEWIFPILNSFWYPGCILYCLWMKNSLYIKISQALFQSEATLWGQAGLLWGLMCLIYHHEHTIEIMLVQIIAMFMYTLECGGTAGYRMILAGTHCWYEKHNVMRFTCRCYLSDLIA